MEDYISNEKKWDEFVQSIKTDFDSLETNKERTKRILKDKFIETVKKNSTLNCGILFSGGIDSTLIAFVLKRLNVQFTCYSVGLENAKDLEAAEKIAQDLNFKLIKKILTLEEFEDIIKSVTKILNEGDVMKVGVGSVVYAGSLLAKNRETNILFSGLGSEELFAGYQRHEISLQKGFKAVHEECFNGLKTMWQRDIKRDLLISKANNIELKLPFLNTEVMKLSMNIHPMHKIDKNTKKIIIREIAEELGIPKEFAWRKKLAAQYGSKFIRGIDKLTKKHGFDKKKNYLQSFIN